MAKRKPKTGTSQSSGSANERKDEGPVPYTPPAREKSECPACGATIVWEPSRETEKRIVPCDPQLRIVVFDIPENDLTALPDDQLVKGVEVDTGKCVWGRVANENERKYYKKHRTLSGLVPWCMARVSHFETCTRWDRWLSGEAKYPTTESGDSVSIPATKGSVRGTNDMASDVESYSEVVVKDQRTT